MENPFETIERRLSKIEELLLDLKHKPVPLPTSDADPYGDFKWLTTTCTGVPASTLRIKSAAGEIPGLVKFGKRVLYDKEAVLLWLKSKTRQLAPDRTQGEAIAEEQISRQLELQQYSGGFSKQLSHS